MQKEGVVFNPEQLGSFIEYVAIEYYGDILRGQDDLTPDKRASITNAADLPIKKNKAYLAFYVSESNVVVVGFISERYESKNQAGVILL